MIAFLDTMFAAAGVDPLGAPPAALAPLLWGVMLLVAVRVAMRAGAGRAGRSAPGDPRHDAGAPDLRSAA